MVKVKKMALVDPTLLEKLEGTKRHDERLKTTVCADVLPDKTEPLLSENGVARTNPFLKNVVEKRLIGLQNFLNRIIKDKPSMKYSYRRLRKYNTALANLIQLRRTNINKAKQVQVSVTIILLLCCTNFHFCFIVVVKNIRLTIFNLLNIFQTTEIPESKLQKEKIVGKEVSDLPESDTDTDTDEFMSDGDLLGEDTTEEEEEEDQEVEEEHNLPPLDKNTLRLAPLSVQERVHSLTSHITERAPNRIKWDKNGAVTIDGEKIKGSNITDILIDLTSQRQEKIPKKGTPGPATGLEKVGKVLKDTNVSRNLIKNLRRKEQVFGSPSLSPADIWSPKQTEDRKGKARSSDTWSPSPIKTNKKTSGYFPSFLGWTE